MYHTYNSCSIAPHTNQELTSAEHPKAVFGRVRIKVFRGYLLCKHPTEIFGNVRYGLNNVPNTPVLFGTTSLREPDNSVSSVRTQYRYPTLP